MFPNDAYGCVNESPYDQAESAWFCLPFPVEVVEGLLHRFPKLFLESLRIQSKELSVKSLNVNRHIDLVAVWYTYKTGPLVNDEAAQPYRKGGQNKDDDDQIDWMRKQAASSPQRPDDRSTGNDPCYYWERKENEGDELTGDPNPENIKLFRI